MNFISILQLISAIVIIILVLFQVNKDSSGLAGLMGSVNSAPKKNSIDKSTKYMFVIILFFIGISFYSSYQKSEKYESVIKVEVTNE